MTELKHTPTPWLVQHEFDNEPSYIVPEKDEHWQGTEIASVPQYHDATFIVRCVNSHDALVQALEAVQDDYRELLRCAISNDESDEIDKMLQIVDSALAQAKGDA